MCFLSGFLLAIFLKAETASAFTAVASYRGKSMAKSPEESELFERYLALLEVVPKRPTYSALEELVAAHMMRIPFENVSKLYYLKRDGLRYIPDFSRYLSGIENFNFGGTCYSNNYYLNRLLRHLGYDAVLCGADMSSPDVHLVNIVTVDGREVLVDTGYAAPFMKPMPRDETDDYVVSLGRDRYVLRPRDSSGCSRVDHYRNGSLTHGYTAKPAPRTIDHFRPAIGSSFDADSTFMNSLLLVRMFENRSHAIRNLSFVTSEGDDCDIRPLANRDELVAVIEQEFGIPAVIASEAVSMLVEFDR